jgi:hypothetical protein
MLDGVLTTTITMAKPPPSLDSILNEEEEEDSMLSTMVARGQWEAVGNMLGEGVGYTRRRWVVKEASKNANDKEFETWVLPHCSDHQLGEMLPALLERGLWKSVGKVLERPGVNEAQRRWALNQARQKADDNSFCEYILPHYSDDQLGLVQANLMERGRWDKVLENVSHAQRKRVVEEGVRKADDFKF